MDRSENMRAVRHRDTAPELAVRSLIHRLGYRFRLHRRDLPGKPDIVLVARRKVIFVHGCFWHLHQCRRSSLPKTNTDFWRNKLTSNRLRDETNLAMLSALGWDSLVLWQCELKNFECISRKLKSFLSEA